jgi:uncharacterized protein YecE (DUF72 family)
MLPYYAERFTSTEINYTFRRIPTPKAILNWCGATPAAFRFAFKAPQRITHFAKLRGCGEILSAFAEALQVADGKQGPVLFQLPPTFHKDAELLEAFLNEVPNPLRSAFEFRHPSWFEDEVFDVLKKANAALCIAESADLKTPAVATADFGYLRLRREDYTSAEIRAWAGWIEKQRARWSDSFVYFKHEERAVGPKFVREMQTELASM